MKVISNKTMYKMKKYFLGTCIAAFTAFSCTEQHTTYSGNDYVMFTDTLQTRAIQNGETYYDIPVSATTAQNYDRTYAVEVVDEGTNAIEGKHFNLESNTITIKAGELATAVKLRCGFDNMEDTDSLGVMLRLVTDNSNIWDTYGNYTKVVFRKSCPFDINMFTGEGNNYAKLVSTYFDDFMQTTSVILLRPKKSDDPNDDPNTIILPDFFYKGYDMKVVFDTTDPLEPKLLWDPQVVGTTAEAFMGNVWGDDKLRAMQPQGVMSYYNVCQNYFLQYMTLYVEGVGTVGTYLNVVEWISEAEYRKLERELGLNNNKE